MFAGYDLSSDQNYETSEEKQKDDRWSCFVGYLEKLSEKGMAFSICLYDEHFKKNQGLYSIYPEDVHDVIHRPLRIIAKYMYLIQEEKQIDLFLNNRYLYEANKYKVDIDLYRRWHDWLFETALYCGDGPQCSGVTKAGQRCKNQVRSEIPEPDKFIFGYHDRCDRHRSEE